MVAVRAFLTPDIVTGGESFIASRQARYERFWQLYQNTAFDNLARYVSIYPPNAKLYARTRGLRNPLSTVSDFWMAMIWGGALDYQAGDGVSKHSAIPVDTDNPALRRAISRVWRWSNWNQKKQLAMLYGIILGDTILEVVDDAKSGQVYFRVRWPGDVDSIEWDDHGNIKYVLFEYDAQDNSGQHYKFGYEYLHPVYRLQKEGVEVDGVTVRTYKNGSLFGYPENDGNAEWLLPYDFVPVVQIPFIDVGIGWGMVRWQQVARLIDEACATASIIHDQLNKELNPPLVTYGITARNMSLSHTDDGIPMIEIPKGPGDAKVDQLIFDMNIADALETLNNDMREIESRLPELKFTYDVKAGTSGATVRAAYAPLINMVRAVRANFDAGLVRAHNMAVAIGGLRGYAEEFAPFNLDSYRAGQLEHDIKDREVVPYSEAEAINEQTLRWQNLAVALNSNMPLTTALQEIFGWDDDKIAATMAEIQRLNTFMPQQ